MNNKIPYYVIKRGTYLFRADEYGKYYGASSEIANDNTPITTASSELLQSPAWFGDLNVMRDDYMQKVGVALQTVADVPLPRLYSFYVHTDIPLIALDLIEDVGALEEWADCRRPERGSAEWFGNLLTSLCGMDDRHLADGTQMARGCAHVKPVNLVGVSMPPGVFLCEPLLYLCFEGEVGVGMEPTEDDKPLDTDEDTGYHGRYENRPCV
jgi:hypothetical protein